MSEEGHNYSFGPPKGGWPKLKDSRRPKVVDLMAALEDSLVAVKEARKPIDITPNVGLRLYLAGPMRGLPHFNFPEFDAGQELCHRLGIHVISPADLDRAEGFDPNGDLGDFDLHAAMRRDIAVVIDPRTDGIVRLRGWETSQGTAVEMTVNQAVGGKTFDIVYDDDKMIGVEEVG